MSISDWVHSKLNARKPEPQRTGRKLYTVLAIDGGGIRGLVAARVVQEIEARLGQPIAKAFDLVVGSSTGGIIALGLTVPDLNDPTKPRYCASQISDIYVKRGHEIFPTRPFLRARQIFEPAYPAAPIEKIFFETMGEARVKQSITSVMVTAYDMEKRDVVLMGNVIGKPEITDGRDFLVRDAARATAAAPTYFAPAEVFSLPEAARPGQPARHRDRFVLVDGGVWANNPAGVGCDLADAATDGNADIMVVSIGTGTSKTPYALKHWGQADWIHPANNVPILSAAMDGQSSWGVKSMSIKLGDRYFRFDMQLKSPGNQEGPSEDYDNASPANMLALEHFARRLIRTNHAQIEKVVDLLRQRMAQGNTPPNNPPVAPSIIRP